MPRTCASWSPHRRLGALLLVVVTLGAGCASITRVNVNTAGGDPNAYGIEPSVSADGRFVAFLGAASDLVPGDGNDSPDVFVRDVSAGTTVRASVNTAGGDPDAGSATPAISAGGRSVAFVSDASNLVPAGDANRVSDVYVRDLRAGTTVRASVARDGGDSNNISYSPSMSADGRYVAFASNASNLVAGDTDNTGDVFVRDLRAGTTVRASVNSAGGDPNGGSGEPSLSADGRYVAFTSGASDLVPGAGNGGIFVCDLRSGTTVRASVNTAGADPNDFSGSPSISADGRYVAFASYASDLVAGDGNARDDVFIRDLRTNVTVRASVDAAGGDANGASQRPSISADGRFVAFSSAASDLVPGDGNAIDDVFVRDRVLGRTLRVSQDALHREGNSLSDSPSMSADGHHVAFQSFADNLAPGDHDGTEDAFLKYARVVTVTGITPSIVPRGARDVRVTITGSGFEPGNVAQVRANGVDITLTHVTVHSDGRMTARLSIPAGVSVGAWDVDVGQSVGVGFAIGQCAGCIKVT